MDVEREKVTFESPGTGTETGTGTACAGYLYRPTAGRPTAAGVAGGGVAGGAVAGGQGLMPCVVMAHGFAGTMDWLRRSAERFASAGIAALTFDYRNFGASGGQPRQLIDIDGQLEDWRAAIRFAREHAELDPQRIALWGSSLAGGHVITLAASETAPETAPETALKVALKTALKTAPEPAPKTAPETALKTAAETAAETASKTAAETALKTAPGTAVRAVVAQVPWLGDGRPAGLKLRHALTLNSIKLTVAAVRDAIRARRGRPPLLMPVVGAPGSGAMFTDSQARQAVATNISEGTLWRNEFAPRMLFGLTRYEPGGLLDRVKVPVLVCAADGDSDIPLAYMRSMLAMAPKADLRTYPGNHFQIYYGEVYERVVSDQTAFLRAHLAA